MSLIAGLAMVAGLLAFIIGDICRLRKRIEKLERQLNTTVFQLRTTKHGEIILQCTLVELAGLIEMVNSPQVIIKHQDGTVYLEYKS